MSDLNDIDTVDIEKVVSVENGGEEPVQASPDPLKSIISAVEPEAVPADELRLPFLFARDKGVLLASDNGNVYLIFKVNIANTTSIMVTIQNLTVIFISCCKSPLPLKITVEPGSTCDMEVR